MHKMYRIEVTDMISVFNQSMEENVGISMPLVTESIVSYEQPNVTNVNKKGEKTVDSAEDAGKRWWQFSEKESNLLKCRVKDSVQRKEYFTAFYGGKTSDVELGMAISNTIRNAYEEAVSGGWLDKDNEKEFLNKMYCDLTRGAVQLAVSSNISEGRALNQQNAVNVQDSKFVYYNAKFYYSCEKAKEVIRDCFDKFSEELGIENLDKEKYLSEHVKNGDDFNAIWSGSYKKWNGSYENCKMINIEAAPPEKFSFFYQVEYADSHNFKEYDYEERHLLLVNGVSSVVKEEVKLSDDTMNRKTFTNLLDYVKSKYLEQDSFWEELHYLKNFKIYSL